MKIFNKVLGITSDDVLACSEYDQLRQWKMSIAVQRADVLFDGGATRENELPVGLRREYLFLRRMETVITRRMIEIKKSNKEAKKAAEAIAFKQSAFRILPRWQFDIINEKSKEEGND